jgi:transposase
MIQKEPAQPGASGWAGLRRNGVSIMKTFNKNHCEICESTIIQPSRGRKRKYCSPKCSYVYHNHKNAVKPKLSGGIVKCVRCGKKFERAENSIRQCCSRLCELAWGRRDEVEEIRRLASQEMRKDNPLMLRNWALEMQYNGYGRIAITEALGLPKRRLKTWSENFSRETDGLWNQCRKRNSKKQPKKPHFSYSAAKTAEDWLYALREGVTDTQHCKTDMTFGSRKIFLVCGITNIHKGADILSTIIQSALKMNPFEGNIFAFCGKNRDKIRYIYWDGSGFNVVMRERAKGTYPWPPPKLGAVISVTPEDFEIILRGERDPAKCGSRPVEWSFANIENSP